MQERGKGIIRAECKGGKSWNCSNIPHEAGKEPFITCYRCGTHMGCSRCTEKPTELLCLHCHNWADRRGVERHGDIVPNFKVPIVNTDAGWIRKHELSKAVNEMVRRGS